MSIPFGETFSLDQALPAGPAADGIAAEERTRILILGAGLAGLTCAYRLMQSSERKLTRPDLLILEREPWVGGRIRSLQIDDVALNLGALTFQPAHYPRYVALLHELGLAEKVRPILRRRMIFGSDARSVRGDNFALAIEGAKGLVGRGMFTPRDAVQLLRFYFYHRHVTSPPHFDEILALHEISTAEWARRFGFSDALYRKVVTSFTQMCFRGPEEVSAAFGVFLIGSNISHPANLKGGFGQIAERMAQSLAGLVETEAVALNVVREPNGFAVLYAQCEQLRRVHSQRLVVAIPANIAAKIFPEMRERASSVQYGAGRGTIVMGKLKRDADLHMYCDAQGTDSVIYGGEARTNRNGTHYCNLLTYRGEHAMEKAKQLFVRERIEQLADYPICPAVAAPKPGQKPLPLEWGEGVYMAGDCVGLFPSQETAVSSGEQVAQVLKKYV